MLGMGFALLKEGNGYTAKSHTTPDELEANGFEHVPEASSLDFHDVYRDPDGLYVMIGTRDGPFGRPVICTYSHRD
ncbi:MAG: hypothetical protein JXC85_00500 [Candidatus Aenigmarchaeota archaeon]|nr:hypothetical protein [Candidatus Aenigmarchaeota archaeon]